MDKIYLLLIIVGAAVILGVSCAALNYFVTKKLKEGTDRMQEIASAIRVGAGAFIKYEYKIVAIIGSIVAAILIIFVSWQTGLAFIIGALVSAAAGFVGMKIATYANVRVTNAANETRDTGKTLKVAFRGGSVMGLCVAGFALFGALLVFAIFGIGCKQIADVVNHVEEPTIWANWTKLDAGFTMTLSGYALGCSIIALFNRVGGGIYTKAADMGADLVGKTEAHIPEDDPRNPATIADNVGDNVGDVAGLGSDLLESFVGAMLSGVILACELFAHNLGAISETLMTRMMLFPMVFAGCGLIGCVVGIFYLLLMPLKKNTNVHMQLNIATWISAGISVVACFLLSFFMFKGVNTTVGEFDVFEDVLGWKAGNFSPWIASVLGIAAGIVIGIISEYYTSYDYKPTKGIAKSSKEGAALTITEGMATGMISCMLPVVVLAVAIIGSYMVCGMYGIACAAIGMLSFVAATVSVDTYGPISDNAGGIAEMSFLDPEVREITDQLDAVGNTTAAIGKGFAIGSASFATISLLCSYLYAFGGIDAAGDLLLNIASPYTLVGGIVGAAIPFMFSGMLIQAVAKAARQMVEEVRRQFKEIPGILEGEAKPDYENCIKISSQGSIKQMTVPCLIAIVIPVAGGFIFGPQFVGGLLIGAIIAAIMLAIYTGNAGGAWDNAKKYIESGGLEGVKKGEEGYDAAHDAAVVGDTVGDPLKDTVGPSLDILIKIMSTISLVMVVLFSKYNLFGEVFHLL
ncbi:MAG: sodium-translocating pyrophosphatase [Clostridiales bacterium]|nr:sodium-translocating pyrophosphatase [Clostridiales bacterium]